MHISEDRLIDLLGGLLSEQEEAASLAHLRDCELCENHFRMLVQERETLRSKPAPRVVGGEIMLPRYEVIQGTASRVLHSRRVRWIGAATAAAAVVTIVIATQFFGPSPSDALDYWLPSPPEEIASDPNAGPPTQLQMALEAYRDHDPARALALMENVGPQKKIESAETIGQLYHVSALLNDNRTAEAQQILDDLHIEDLPQPWRARAVWVKYVALRKAHDDSQATRVLNELVDEPGEIGDMARKERERLAGD